MTPASAERALRPLQLALGGQQEPGRLHTRLRAQQKKRARALPPPPVSDAWAQPGLETTFPRGGGRRAQAGTRICHLKSTNHEVARPCRLRYLTPARALYGPLLTRAMCPSSL